MRLKGIRRSRNIEDRRRAGGRRQVRRGGRGATGPFYCPAGRKAQSTIGVNALTVRLELQADYLSGVWASAVNGLLEPGDLEEALNAARKIGDDTLQKRAGRVPQPHSFAHGTSKQRARWFARGYDSGAANQCDTFSAQRL